MRKVRGAINYMNGFTQAEPPLSLGGTATRREHSEAARQMAADANDTMAWPVPSSDDDFREDVVQTKLDLSAMFPKLDLAALSKQLGPFNVRFQNYVQSATVSSSTDQGTTIKEQQFEPMLQQMKEILENSNDKATSNGDTSLVEIDHCYPGPLSPEVAFVQPVSRVLLAALGKYAAQQEALWQPPSPVKGKVQSNRIVPEGGFTQRRRRITDKSLVSPGRFVFYMRDESAEIRIEEKPGVRKNHKVQDIDREGTAQLLASLSKHIGVAFNFAGLGTDDCRATGLLLTPDRVFVVRIVLEHVGTPRARLEIETTGPLPLLNRPNYDKYINAAPDAHRGDLEALGEVMYPYPPTENEVPLGLLAMYAAMVSRRADMYGSSTWTTSDQVGDLIAYGSFGTVHAHPTKTDAVVKLSRFFGRRAHLDREKKALSFLQGTDGVVQRIGGDEDEISLCIRGSVQKVPALILSPKGLSFKAAARSYKLDLPLVWNQLHDTLTAIHDKQIVHCDVTPHNIIFVDVAVMDGSPILKPVLIDFGVAAVYGEMYRGVVGTPEFSHLDVLNSYPSLQWLPLPKHDKASLGLTIAVAQNHFVLPWDSLHPRSSSVASFERFDATRVAAAQDILRDMHPALTGQWLQSILKNKSKDCERGRE